LNCLYNVGQFDHPRLNRGLSYFGRTHRLVASYNWEYQVRRWFGRVGQLAAFLPGGRCVNRQNQIVDCAAAFGNLGLVNVAAGAGTSAVLATADSPRTVQFALKLNF
jgi:hypothetical protein